MKIWRSAVLAGVLAVPALAQAATTQAVDVTAEVTPTTNLTCAVVRCTADATGTETCNTTPEPTAVMDFGTLGPADPTNPSSALSSDHFFKVFCGVNTSGRPYTVTQTGTALTNENGVAIPNNAWVFTPIAFVDTTDADNIANEPLPGDAAVGGVASANSTNALWIDTGSQTNIVVVQAAYGVTGDPRRDADLSSDTTGDLIPPTQQAGSYQSSVTWTLTPK
ncbi:MAG: hypothetical protein HYZ92_00575 [Candidatus Omnitrophica bacterium]|nr:hypothetical protein [Candidatus Omnitrophota bacterium]